MQILGLNEIEYVFGGYPCACLDWIKGVYVDCSPEDSEHSCQCMCCMILQHWTYNFNNSDVDMPCPWWTWDPISNLLTSGYRKELRDRFHALHSNSHS